MAKRINIKKSILLIKFLTEEKEECEDICNTAKREFEESIIQAHYDYNVHDEILDKKTQPQTSEKAESNDEDSVQDTEETATSKAHPDWIKKLYRKIAIATHPDKMQKSASDNMKKRLLEIYTK